MQKVGKNLKVCYVLSYKSPDYIRTRVILNALSLIKHVDVSTAVNRSKSFIRYVETIGKVILVRFRHQPDIYIVGFRGHEIYWPVRILTFPRPIVFDEFINVDDWLFQEKKILRPNTLLRKLLRSVVRLILDNANLILSDTNLDAISSSKTYNIPIEKYKVVYVGADENIFKQYSDKPQRKSISVFFYGNMAPLHGVEIILEAAMLVRSLHINFHIVGGKGNPATINKIRSFISRHELSNVVYEEWAPFDTLPKLVEDSDLCLGGPFGYTSQSKRVITGKTFQFLASAKPTIIGEIEEEVGLIDKLNCILIEQGSSKSLAAALEWALKHKKRLPSIGQAGFGLFKEKFSTQAVAHNLEEIIESL